MKLWNGCRKSGARAWIIVFFVALLVFPTLAVCRLSRRCDARLIVGYLIVVSGLSYFLYRRDKRKAEAGAWRIPESTLHLTELAGGWPGAFIAQRVFRHKIRKLNYQLQFWTIIASHQFMAFDFLQDWRYSRQALSLLQP